MQYHLTDCYGRAYGISSEDREYLIREAKQIPEHGRPFGVWIVSDDESDLGQEIIPNIAQ